MVDTPGARSRSDIGTFERSIRTEAVADTYSDWRARFIWSMVNLFMFGLTFGAVGLGAHAAGLPTSLSAAVAIVGGATGLVRAVRLGLVDRGEVALVRNPIRTCLVQWRDVERIGVAAPTVLKGAACPSFVRRAGKPVAICGLLVFGRTFSVSTTDRDAALIDRVRDLARAHGVRWTDFRSYCDNALGHAR